MYYFCTDANTIPAMKAPFVYILAASVLLLLPSGCRQIVVPEIPEPSEQTVALNRFAYNMIDTYYLWVDEKQVKDVMDRWYTVDDPTEMVRKVRFKAADGSDIDRWSQMIDGYSTFYSSVSGVETTYGFDFVLFYTDQTRSAVCAVIQYVYRDSPAEMAGLRRGDVISKVNGRTMTADDYSRIVSEELMAGDKLSIVLSDGRSIDLRSATMYEDPIICSKVFDVGGKKVGYIAYTSFTLDSCEPFVELSRSFREQGVDELILDLRYNRGGYVMTERVLSSLLAPEANVKAGDVFTKEVYNSLLSIKWGDGRTLLQTDFAFESADGRRYKFSTDGANMQLSKVYAIITGSTASASESLLTGLIPYMDVELIGTRSYGKYCGGIMYSAAEWYDDLKDKLKPEDYESGRAACGDWGIYVMMERFADRNGNTPCMPDGFEPDVEVQDRPQEPYQLGDPSEAMLAVALERAGYRPSSPRQVQQNRTAGTLVPCGDVDAGRIPGLRIFGR